MAHHLSEEKLTVFCERTLGEGGNVSNLKRLSGGASMESWSFTYAREAFVLRRLPIGMAQGGENELRGVPLDTQADIIELAVQSGVTAPVVRARLSPEDEIGEGFVMDKAEGETLPHKILGKPDYALAQSKLTAQCATELWKIHNIDTQSIASSLEYFSPLQLVALQKEKYHEIGGAIPIFEYAFQWLENNAPEGQTKNLVHGDFRMGNLMISPTGITAVLDWELTRLGDPIQDLAYLCTPSWRFGHYENVAGGFDTAESFLSAYAQQSGQIVDADRFRFWLIYSTMWWGISCLVMGEIWRTGGDRSLERTVIGRRVSEVEIDLALLFEEILSPTICTKLDWQLPETETPIGETEYAELLTALGEWNSDIVQPDLTGHNRFQSRVAGNALGIAQRQAKMGPVFLAASQARLNNLGLDHEQLCKAIADREMTAEHPGLWDHLRISALERLSIDQPKYAGLAVALNKWRP
ncbi:MAG: phosphotransferase family protein [Parasphingorhabdus sp.]|uniref:phosphotransferase family protein n=1 Tax=Parasphingorhabdus sp. TaxID=2709688 RepID=UPI003299B28A